MKKLILSLTVITLLSACSSGHRDLNMDLTGTNKLEKSPCACMDLNYEAPQLKFNKTNHG